MIIFTAKEGLEDEYSFWYYYKKSEKIEIIVPKKIYKKLTSNCVIFVFYNLPNIHLSKETAGISMITFEI